MTKKTSCHLPFNVERQKLETRQGNVIKTRISDQLTLCLLWWVTVILTTHCGCVDDKLCNKWSSLRSIAGDASVLESLFYFGYSQKGAV